jgi:hypothetical protein
LESFAVFVVEADAVAANGEEISWDTFLPRPALLLEVDEALFPDALVLGTAGASICDAGAPSGRTG